MPVQSKIFKQKISSVKSIAKITKAMELISISKMKKSIQKHKSSDEYAIHSLSVLENLSTHRNLSNIYLEGRDKTQSKRILLIIISSNKGLCGGYNANVSKKVSKFIMQNPDCDIDAITIGKQSNKIALRNNINVIASFTEYSEYFSSTEIRSIMTTMYEIFDSNEEFSSVVAFYTRFMSSIKYEPKSLSIIPLVIQDSRKALGLSDNVNDSKMFGEYSYEPSEQEVLDTIVPRMQMTIIYQLLLDSIASEHSSRVLAMKNASDNAEDLLDDLKVSYNRARQANITQEIAEIVGGSSAISQ